VIASDPDTLKFAKRKLRVQRCKNTSSKPPVKTPTEAAPKAVRPRPLPVPAMDPALGEKLAHLSKEERKAAKSENADRVQRRLLKKKARGKLDIKVYNIACLRIVQTFSLLYSLGKIVRERESPRPALQTIRRRLQRQGFVVRKVQRA
jgi:hypothetical protein